MRLEFALTFILIAAIVFAASIELYNFTEKSKEIMRDKHNTKPVDQQTPIDLNIIKPIVSNKL